jgi:branched-chain amino acid transport system ATP-binding protein
VVDQMFDVIRTIYDEGVAILLVEQNVAKALDIANRVYVLEEGRFVAEGPPSLLLSQSRIQQAYLGLRDA